MTNDYFKDKNNSLGNKPPDDNENQIQNESDFINECTNDNNAKNNYKSREQTSADKNND